MVGFVFCFSVLFSICFFFCDIFLCCFAFFPVGFFVACSLFCHVFFLFLSCLSVFVTCFFVFVTVNIIFMFVFFVFEICFFVFLVLHFVFVVVLFALSLSCITKSVRETFHQICIFRELLRHMNNARPWVEAVWLAVWAHQEHQDCFRALLHGMGSAVSFGKLGHKTTGFELGHARHLFKMIFSSLKCFCRSASGAALPTLRLKASGLLK